MTTLTQRLARNASASATLRRHIDQGGAPRCHGRTPKALRQLVGRTAIAFQLPVKVLFTRTRTGRLPLARQLFTLKARGNGFSYIDIGQVLGLTESFARTAEATARDRIKTEKQAKELYAKI